MTGASQEFAILIAIPVLLLLGGFLIGMVYMAIAITAGVIHDLLNKGHSQREETIRQTGDPNGRP